MQSGAIFWVFVTLMAASSVSGAQQMYRCGSTYQDRPCEAGTPDKVFHSSTPAGVSASGAQQLMDSDCIKRGVQAQQIVWSRESGKTADDLTAKAPNEPYRKLIADVYAVRGTAPEVRSLIQTKCMQEKEQAAQMAAMVAAMAKGQPTGNPAPEVKPNPNGNSNSNSNPEPAKASVVAKNGMCDSYKAQLENIVSQERRGGSVAVMEYLRQQRANIENNARGQGCR